MQKIDKSKILSTEYKQWADALTLPHPLWASKHKYYRDVIMNLYHCQNGLCAYTEKDIFEGNHELFLEKNWKNGRYKVAAKLSFSGEVEHFDASLKTTNAWQWDNLFVVFGKVNQEKSTKKIDARLKPDNLTYDPFRELEYDCEKHIFIPNTTTYTTQSDIETIKQSILNLGLNFVVGHRERVIKKAMKKIEFGIETWESIEIYEYPTAFSMLKDNYKNLKST
jgi:hypothetical protein